MYVYKLILIVYLTAGGGGSISQHEIGQFGTKETCRDAAVDAILINRTTPATTASVGWNLICVNVPESKNN
jgi:hypothetical protein